MNEFYEGLISGVALLGGLCAFNYWVFTLLEKRLEEEMGHLEHKIDNISSRLEEVIHEQADQRKRTDQLYQIVIDLLQSRSPKTNP